MAEINLSKFSISAINETDWEVYKKIRLSALLESPQAFATKYEDAKNRTAESWKNQCNEMAQRTNAIAFIGYLNHLPISLCGLYRNKNQDAEWEIVQVWTDPFFRGKGISAEMFAHVINWSKHEHIEKLLAKVYADNNRAKKFYTKMGFRTTEITQSEELMYREL